MDVKTIQSQNCTPYPFRQPSHKDFHNRGAAHRTPGKCNRCRMESLTGVCVRPSYRRELAIGCLIDTAFCIGLPIGLLLSLENFNFDAESAESGAFEVSLRAETFVELLLQVAFNQFRDVEHLFEHLGTVLGRLREIQFGVGSEPRGIKNETRVPY